MDKLERFLVAPAASVNLNGNVMETSGWIYNNERKQVLVKVLFVAGKEIELTVHR